MQINLLLFCLTLSIMNLSDNMTLLTLITLLFLFIILIALFFLYDYNFTIKIFITTINKLLESYLSKCIEL